ncbi:MAG: hypothetical protein ACJAYG_002366 [Oceanicoccus sp.]|jgi:hypothetical protein
MSAYQLTPASKSTIREEMPILAKHAGTWEGVYRYYTADGKLVGQHDSRILCRFMDEGNYPYYQTNIYTYPDGRQEIKEFPCVYENFSKVVIFKIGTIEGWVKEDSDMPGDTTCKLYWERYGNRNIKFYEMIQTDPDFKHRTRVWQWLLDGKNILRTLINETKVSDTCDEYEDYDKNNIVTEDNSDLIIEQLIGEKI